MSVVLRRFPPVSATAHDARDFSLFLVRWAGETAAARLHVVEQRSIIVSLSVDILITLRQNVGRHVDAFERGAPVLVTLRHEVTVILLRPFRRADVRSRNHHDGSPRRNVTHGARDVLIGQRQTRRRHVSPGLELRSVNVASVLATFSAEVEVGWLVSETLVVPASSFVVVTASRRSVVDYFSSFRVGTGSLSPSHVDSTTSVTLFAFITCIVGLLILDCWVCILA